MDLENNVKALGGSALHGGMGFVNEFKQFISRGNVVDLAVGVIIGGAFGNIVNSLVKDVVMPPIGWLTSGHDFSSLKIVIQQGVPDPKDATKFLQPEVAIGYGAFLNTVLSFLIVAFSIFIVIKFISSLKRKEAAQPSAPPAPSAEEKLLEEIRDLLKARP